MKTVNDKPIKVQTTTDSSKVVNDTPYKVTVVGGGGEGDDAVQSVNGKTGDVVLDKDDIGLDNVDNTSDIDKPISSAVNQALSEKADLQNGKISESQLPSYVDDVLVFDEIGDFPEDGEDGKIYIDTDSNLTYRWSGSGYVEISPSIALGETASTAFRGDRGKIAFDHTNSTSNPHSVTKEQVGLGNVNNTSDLEKPISAATQTALDDKLTFNDLDTALSIKQDLLPQAPSEGTFSLKSVDGELTWVED